MRRQLHLTLELRHGPPRTADCQERQDSFSGLGRAAGVFLVFRVPRDSRKDVRFHDAVYGDQSKETADIEDFALLRSDGMPTYHLGSCTDDADLRISPIIRGQDHVSNTF